MNYAQINQRYLCGIDLRANSMYLKSMDREGQVHYKRNMPNNFALFKKILAPYLPDIAVGVESTFNYYWLYAGCLEAGIPFYLGYAAYMKAIAGNKKKNDPLDAETIAHLMRGNLFPQAYPYPSEMRAVRDLLRRRHRLVRHRSEAYTHVEFRGRDVKSISGKEQILKSVADPDVYYLVNSDLLLIDQLDNLLSEIEKQIKTRAYYHNGTDYSILKTVTGVGGKVTAAYHGGGIWCRGETLILTNVTIHNNSAIYNGGGIYGAGGILHLTNVTISDNFAGETGGGITGGDSSSTIVNSILWNNSPDQIDQISEDEDNNISNIFYSNVMGGWSGVGNINTNPRFMDATNGDFRLQSGSPCIDAGIQDKMIIYNHGHDTLLVPQIDYAGSGPDIGAYEYGDPLALEQDNIINPRAYTLNQNYPNPFNPSTTIEFTLPKSEFVELKVYNILGREVSTLVSKKLNQGTHTYNFDGKNLASGIYYYQLVAGEYREVRKMILLK